MATHGYSSTVSLHLLVDGRMIPLAQVGPDYAILREPMSLPQCNAEIIVGIDGREHRSAVRLVDGAAPDNETVRTISCVE